jgi:hypothetical protein
MNGHVLPLSYPKGPAVKDLIGAESILQVSDLRGGANLRAVIAVRLSLNLDSGQQRDSYGWRDLASDLREGIASQILPLTHGEFAQPRVDRGVLLGPHFFKQHAHAKDPEAAAGVHVEHLAM